MDEKPHDAVTFRHPDQSAFAVWLGRTLRRSHDDAMHEPIPAELLKLLPPEQEPH